MQENSPLYAGFWLLALFILLRTGNQILFKHLALGPGGGAYRQLLVEPLFYLTGLIFGTQMLVWMLILRRVPLSTVYPFTSLTIITLLISGHLFFGEPITMANIVGSIVIMAGVWLIAARGTT